MQASGDSSCEGTPAVDRAAAASAAVAMRDEILFDDDDDDDDDGELLRITITYC